MSAWRLLSEWAGYLCVTIRLDVVGIQCEMDTKVLRRDRDLNPSLSRERAEYLTGLYYPGRVARTRERAQRSACDKFDAGKQNQKAERLKTYRRRSQ